MVQFLFWIVSAPARLKGAKLGRNVRIGPGFDWLLVNWSNITIDSNTTVGRRAWIQTVSKSRGRIHIGPACSIGRDCVISSAAEITVGTGTLISYRVSIIDHDHRFIPGESPVGIDIGDASRISIGSRCFIGCNTTILKGAELGDDVIVAAHSVVTKSFPNNVVIAGAPARVISERRRSV